MGQRRNFNDTFSSKANGKTVFFPFPAYFQENNELTRISLSLKLLFLRRLFCELFFSDDV